MFTGWVQAIGKILKKIRNGKDVRLTVSVGNLDMTNVRLGESISVNGVCLTVVEFDDRSFSVDVSTETLSCTSLNALTENAPVNLEKALLPTTRLGGHIVSGHVDGMATITRITEDGASKRVTIEVPVELSRYIAPKCSVCVDGVSLTVNEVAGHTFCVCIIPHTQQETVFQYYREGDQVNIEVDVVARYAERLLARGLHSAH